MFHHKSLITYTYRKMAGSHATHIAPTTICSSRAMRLGMHLNRNKKLQSKVYMPEELIMFNRTTSVRTMINQLYTHCTVSDIVLIARDWISVIASWIADYVQPDPLFVSKLNPRRIYRDYAEYNRGTLRYFRLVLFFIPQWQLVCSNRSFCVWPEHERIRKYRVFYLVFVMVKRVNLHLTSPVPRANGWRLSRGVSASGCSECMMKLKCVSVWCGGYVIAERWRWLMCERRRLLK